MGRGRPKGSRSNGSSKASKKRYTVDSDEDNMSRMSSSSSVQALDNDGYTEPARKRTGGRAERPAVNYAEARDPSYDRDNRDYLSYLPSSGSNSKPRTESSYSLSSSSIAKTSRPEPTPTFSSSSYYRESKPPGKQADMVVASQMRGGELHLLIKWKNSDDAEMIPAKEARYKYPEAVINYYEEKFVSQLRDGTQHALPTRKSFQ